jgi:fumarate reductase subunit C
MVKKQRNLFNAKTNNPYAAGANSGNAAPVEARISKAQVNVLQQVYDEYTTMLSNKSYEKIPTNYPQYLNLLKQLKSINVQDSKLMTMITIVENSLIGAINVNTLYTSYSYNEIKVALLNKRINEILSNKNMKETISTTSGQFAATKTIKLSPIFSYYVYLYGVPEYGVGFDPVKLAFIQSLPLFTIDPTATNVSSITLQ